MTLKFYIALGDCLTRLRRFEEAEALLIPSYHQLKAQLGDQHERTQEALLRIRSLYQEWNQPEKAHPYL